MIITNCNNILGEKSKHIYLKISSEYNILNIVVVWIDTSHGVLTLGLLDRHVRFVKCDTETMFCFSSVANILPLSLECHSQLGLLQLWKKVGDQDY